MCHKHCYGFTWFAEIVGLIVLNAIFGIPFYHQLAYAQEGTLPISHLGGRTADHDYFDESDDTKVLLRQVEEHHLYECPHSPKGGVFADIAQGRYDYALSDLDYLLVRIVNHPKALQLMSSLAIAAKRPRVADRYFSRAVSLYPQYALTHAQYGSYLISSGEVDAGIARLERAVEIDPELAIAYAWLSKGYTQNGNRDRALKAAEQARALGYKGEPNQQDEVLGAAGLDNRGGKIE